MLQAEFMLSWRFGEDEDEDALLRGCRRNFSSITGAQL